MRKRITDFINKLKGKPTARPRILLLVDTANWAFDTAAQAIGRTLSDEFEFHIEYVSNRRDLSQWPFDLVYVFFWGETYHEKYVSDVRQVVKEISSHRWALEDRFGCLRPEQALKVYLSNAGTLTATSRRLQCLFAPYREVFLVPNGYNPKHFYFRKKRTGPLRIGWAGNEKDPCKGLNDILRPAADSEFNLVIAGGRLNKREMLEFYNSIDVLCVASTAEGEPLTLIEAMACGCFPVCVDVGIVPEVIKSGENGLIVERSVPAFHKAFEWCAENLDLVRKAGRQNARTMRKTRTWKNTAWYWRMPLRHAVQARAGKTTVTAKTATTWQGSADKPRVLLIADVPDWIFARHCKVLQKFLGACFEFQVQYLGQSVDEDAFDLIYALEYYLANYKEITRPEKWVTGIRSHTVWQHLDFRKFVSTLNEKFGKLHAVSRRLLNILKPYVPAMEYLTHGVDTHFFTPRTKADQSGCKLRLGWAGSRNNSTKGFAEYILPLGKVPGVELVYCGHLDNNLGLDQMREFYNSLDAYICASATEGNNNSLLEAASMCRAIITTDSGTVPEYLVHGESALIVERSLRAFTGAVESLRDNPDTRVALGAQARAQVQAKFEWSRMAECYHEFFRSALEKTPSKSNC